MTEMEMAPSSTNGTKFEMEWLIIELKCHENGVVDLTGNPINAYGGTIMVRNSWECGCVLTLQRIVQTFRVFW